MVLPINIDVLLGNSVVESNRIEYKAGGIPTRFIAPSAPSQMTLMTLAAVIL